MLALFDYSNIRLNTALSDLFESEEKIASKCGFRLKQCKNISHVEYLMLLDSEEVKQEFECDVKIVLCATKYQARMPEWSKGLR